MQPDAKLKALESLSGDQKDYLEVSVNFKVKEGSELIEGVKLGKTLGKGLQGIVYELEFSDGSLTGWVLKADAGNVTAKAMPPMVLEWALGRALMKAMGRAREGPRPDVLPGFMRTGCAVVSEGKLKFIGQILEFLSGQTMDKILQDAPYTSMQSLQCMLLEVFKALALAQKATSFRHWDLRLSNVMEHTDSIPSPSEAICGSAAPPPNSDAPREEQEGEGGQGTVFKIIDFGHGQMKGRGDVFRILMSLSNVIDGRQWRDEDRELLTLLSDLIQSVTGVRLKATFSESDGSIKKTSSLLRRTVIRVFSFWHFCGGNIAAEKALHHPLFNQKADN